MSNENLWVHSAISPSKIEAVVRKARVERAEVMRESLGEAVSAFKRWVSSFRADRAAAPQKGALA